MAEESLEVADFTAHVRRGCVSGGTLYSPEERPPPLGWTRVNNDKTQRLPHPPQVRICAQKPNRFISHSERQLGDLCDAISPAWHSIGGGGGGGRGGGGVGAFFFFLFLLLMHNKGKGEKRSREPVPDCQPDPMAPPSLGSQRAQTLLQQQAIHREAN